MVRGTTGTERRRLTQTTRQRHADSNTDAAADNKKLADKQQLTALGKAHRADEQRWTNNIQRRRARTMGGR